MGVAHEVAVSDVEERLPPLDDPCDPAPLALAKARDISAQHPDAIVLGGDTIVTVEGEALGKPGTPEVAHGMLRRLRGRRHAVRTALALVHPTGEAQGAGGPGGEAQGQVVAPLTMLDYSDIEITQYVATGEPLDCAGGYDIHREGGALIASVEGCFSCIVGLPIAEAARLLRSAGVDAPNDPAKVCADLYGRPCLAATASTRSRCLSE